jgi:hypothetical protein
MSPTISRRRLVVVALVALALVGCRKDKPMPDRDPAPAPAPAPGTVTLVGTLTALGRPPGTMPGETAATQSVSLRVESAEGKDLAAGTVVEITITILSHVPKIAGSPVPAPELDPAYFRVGRRFRIATTPANDRYYARIDKGAIEPLD